MRLTGEEGFAKSREFASHASSPCGPLSRDVCVSGCLIGIDNQPTYPSFVVRCLKEREREREREEKKTRPEMIGLEEIGWRWEVRQNSTKTSMHEKQAPFFPPTLSAVREKKE